MATMTNNTQFIFFFIFVWIISTLLLQYIFKKPSKQTTNLCLSPSPLALLIIGHIHYLSPLFHKCYQSLASKYGPLLYLRLASYPLVLISYAAMATEIFKTQDAKFANRPQLVNEDQLLLGKSGFILAPYGDYWRFMKKLCMTELLGTRQLERSRNVRHEELLQFLQKLMEKAQKNEVVDVGGELNMLTNNTICRMAMSTRCSGEDSEAEKCRQLVKKTMEIAGKLYLANLLGPFRRLGFWVCQRQASNVERQLDQLFEKLWKEHEERGRRDGDEKEDKDLMDILLEIYEDEDAEIKITRTL